MSRPQASAGTGGAPPWSLGGTRLEGSPRPGCFQVSWIQSTCGNKCGQDLAAEEWPRGVTTISQQQVREWRRGGRRVTERRTRLRTQNQPGPQGFGRYLVSHQSDGGKLRTAGIEGSKSQRGGGPESRRSPREALNFSGLACTSLK